MRTSISIKVKLACGQFHKIFEKLLEHKQKLKFGGVIDSVISYISSLFPISLSF